MSFCLLFTNFCVVSMKKFQRFRFGFVAADEHVGSSLKLKPQGSWLTVDRFNVFSFHHHVRWWKLPSRLENSNSDKKNWDFGASHTTKTLTFFCYKYQPRFNLRWIQLQLSSIPNHQSRPSYQSNHQFISRKSLSMWSSHKNHCWSNKFVQIPFAFGDFPYSFTALNI